MKNLQFRVLYRQFVFRIINLEWLSQEADIHKLLGQFAALFVFLSLLFSLPIWGLAIAQSPVESLKAASFGFEHFLIATTMLAVGILAVLSWDSLLPDQRDVLVLAPLPLRARTVFLAKAAATATVLGLAVVALNLCTGLIAPLVFAPSNGTVLDIARSFAGYWATMITAGLFIYCGVLGVQGLSLQLLPRRAFLQLSSLLQMLSLCLFVSVYFLQPSAAVPQTLAAGRNPRWLAWSPSYWFLGLYQELNGSIHPALNPLARRAWTGMAAAACVTIVTYGMFYLRMLRKIAEEPDIVPRSRGMSWLPGWGDSIETALLHFTLRTLFRSRQHRLYLGFYVAVGFALVIIWVKTLGVRRELFAASPWQQVNAPMLAASLVMIFFLALGTRAVFALPLDLAANWVFRVIPIASLKASVAATRHALYFLAIAPVWTGSAAVFLWLWPWKPAAGHLATLAGLGFVITEICLADFYKIPFTCSYLPGKSNVYRAFWLCVGLGFILADECAKAEIRMLEHPLWLAVVLALLMGVGVCAKIRTARQIGSPAVVLQFEEAPPPAVIVLGLD